jgi:hypothetical protein
MQGDVDGKGIAQYPVNQQIVVGEQWYPGTERQGN